VPLVAAVVRRQEGLDEAERGVLVVHPATEADHVRVVVLAAERGGLDAPRQRAPHTAHLVGRDRLAVARAADHHAQAVRLGGGRLRRPQDVRRVVVLGVVLLRPVVDRLVPQLPKPAQHRRLELEAGMVGAEVHAHVLESDACRSSAPCWSSGRTAARAAAGPSPSSIGGPTAPAG
jgi:hypothetical protein